MKRKHLRINNTKVQEIRPPGKIGPKTLRPVNPKRFPTGRGSYKKLSSEDQDSELILGEDIIFDDLSKSSHVLLISDTRAKKLLLDNGIIGEPIGAGRRKDRQYELHPSPLAISPYDLLFAFDLGLLSPEINSNWIDLRQDIVDWGRSYHENFNEKYASYLVLRKNGLIVMDGLKYGVDFTIYEESPQEFLEKGQVDHGPAIIEVITDLDDLTIKETIKGELFAKQLVKKYYIMHPNVTVDEFSGEIKGNVNVYAVDTSGLKLNYGDHSVESLIIRDLIRAGNVEVIPIELEWMVQDRRFS